MELDLLADIKSSIVIIFPNGVTLTQPIIYETRFCKLCKVLGHKTRACSPTTASQETRHMDSKVNPSKASDKHRSVFDRLGPVAEPSMGSADTHVIGPAHSVDPMSTEVVVAFGEWEIVKSKRGSWHIFESHAHF